MGNIKACRRSCTELIAFLLGIIVGIGPVIFATPSLAADNPSTPFAILKAQELAHRHAKGEVYLGNVLTVNYSINSARVRKKYERLLLELADALKTPERRSYRLVIKGYTDSTGPLSFNKKLSLKRAKELKRLLVEKYFLDPARITVKAYGPQNPVASNATPSGRALNRRSEIHVYGDVSEAVKLLVPPPAPKVKKEEEAVPFEAKKPVVAVKPKKTEPKVSAKPSRGTPPLQAPLPEALAGVSIRDYFVPSAEKKAGFIKAMIGHVVVVHRGTKEAYFARAGDTIYQNDAVYTFDKSRCRINFFDDDVVSMGANTQFSVDLYEDKREQKKKTSFFSMLRGKAMFYALRLFRYKQMAFRVKTPTAVVGVRGTKFGVYVRWMEEKSATSGAPLVASSDPNQAFVAGVNSYESAKVYTDVFCEDGLLDVNGVKVPGGYTYHGQTGAVTPSDPGYIREFERDTAIVVSKVEKLEKQYLRPAFDLLRSLDLDWLAGQLEQAGDTINDQNVIHNLYTNAHVGYFTGMLTDNTPGYISLQDIYISPSHQDFDSDTVTATSLSGGLGYITVKPGVVNNNTSYLTRIVTQGYAAPIDSGDLGTQYPLDVTKVGSNDYMQWGYWTMQNAWTYSGTDYIINSPAWYVFGQPTSPTVIQQLGGTVSYSGQAFGTYHPAWGSGVEMEGNFSCKVDFDSGSISNFNLNVSGGSYSATITNAKGTLSGGHFSLSEGTWSLTTGTATEYGARGTFYGPAARYIGGNWGMRNATGDAASGIFEGSK